MRVGDVVWCKGNEWAFFQENWVFVSAPKVCHFPEGEMGVVLEMLTSTEMTLLINGAVLYGFTPQKWLLVE
jgi:hypothetical protein